MTRERLLIVEDEAIVAEDLRDMLTRLRYDVWFPVRGLPPKRPSKRPSALRRQDLCSDGYSTQWRIRRRRCR